MAASLLSMRRAVPAAAAVLVLAGPTALAFFSGGYFTEPRLVAALAVWLMLLLLALVGPAPLPCGLPGWLAVGGLAAIAIWSAISIAWAPLGGPAVGDVQRLVLYTGALLLAITVVRMPLVARIVEPALAAGATIVICYGLSGRLLPGVVHLSRSAPAGGRLEQPITYWNGEGALAAVGFLLCARLAGDRSRPTWMRCLAAAAVAPLGAGVYLSYSRGAIAAAVVGLVVLVAAAPFRSQLRAALLALAVGVASSLCASAFGGVASLSGGLGARERDGAIVLGIMLLLAAAAGAVAAREAAVERAGATSDDHIPGRARLGPLAAAVIGLVALGLLIGGLREKGGAPAKLARANATRLTSVQSNRYYYWRVGGRAFVHHPLDGLGAGGFRVAWLRERPFKEGVLDVHSLELEMASELGLVGLLSFGVMVTGVGLGARRALRSQPALAAGACAATLAWLLHASIDWDWELPAVTLPALVLAGALIALGEKAAGSAGTEGERVEPPDRRQRAPSDGGIAPAADHEQLAPRG